MLTSGIIIFAALFLYIFGYKIYARLIDRDVVIPDDAAKTPAHTQQDNSDFVPAPAPILFGHHFSSIAGAGPIIGPIVAVSNFGWFMTLIWILLGNIFIGAVHDYLTLMISVRNKGASVADIADRAMGRRAKVIFSIFLWLAMILVVSVFGIVAAKTMVGQPRMVFPTFMLIPVAIAFGWAVYRKGYPLWICTILAVGMNIINIYIGYYFPISLPDTGILGLNPINFWFLILMLYAAVASLLPVNVLLQPRDYIATYLLYGTLGLGILSLIYVMPDMNAPAVISFQSAQGPLWPMLFVLVACGAVSGFHSLVSGGTTSKQLNRETEGRIIGYGAMLLEGVLAVLALLVVSAGLYWKTPSDLKIDMNLVGFHEVMARGGWILVFGNGFGNILNRMLPFLGFGISAMIAMMTLKTFILTTLDTGTRITRYIIQESIGVKIPLFRNRYVAILFVIIPSYYLGVSNAWSKMWPIFGATNQLIAALALFVISAYLIGIRRPTRYTLYPALFMIATTIGALSYQAYGFMTAEKTNILLGTTSIILILLTLFVGYEGFQALSVTLKRERAVKPV